MATYKMGQYRFSSTNECMSELTATPGYRDVSFSITGDETSSTAFQDVVLNLDSPLMAETSYHLSLSIPKDLNYTGVYIIKLYKNLSDGGDTEVYQRLKKITVLQGGAEEGDSNIKGVALYDASPNNTEDVRAMIPFNYDPSLPGVNNLLYKDMSDNFYIGRGNFIYDLTNKVNYLKVVEAWKESSSTVQDNVELVFTPVENGFDKIVLEMVRDAEDYTIQRTDSSGNTRYGRVIDLDHFNFSLYQLANLVSKTDATTLTTIGISAHPGLLMAINGEEIRVPISGFYELSNVLNITSIGVAAKNAGDSFVLDYQYRDE